MKEIILIVVIVISVTLNLFALNTITELPTKDVFQREIKIVLGKFISEVEEISKTAILSKIQMILESEYGVELLEREDIETLLQEKRLPNNISSLDKKFIESAEYFLKGEIYKEQNEIFLHLNFVDTGTLSKFFSRTYQYAFEKNGVTILNHSFDALLKNYIQQAVNVLSAPINTNCRDYELNIEVNEENGTVFHDEEVISFKISSSFPNNWIFSATPNGSISYLKMGGTLGNTNLSAQVELSDTTAEVKEYILIVGTERKLEEEMLYQCNNIYELSHILNIFSSDSQYSISYDFYLVGK